MKKYFFSKKVKGRTYEEHIPSVMVCPNCYGHNYVGRVNCSLFFRLLTGSWWCKTCRRPFHRPVNVRKRIM
jgi:hypothetical protein